MIAESRLWVNGQPCALTGPHISATDRGFTVADGLFETMLIRNGSVLRLDAHFARLTRGLSVFDIPSPPLLRDWVLEAVHSLGRTDAGLRVTVSRGTGSFGVAPPTDPAATVVVAISPPPSFSPAIYSSGLTAHVASGRRNEHSMTAGLKTLAYTDAIAAWIEAHRAGADEALFLDTSDHCSEASASNLFVWTGSLLATPPVTCGALPGITRSIVIDLARALKVPVSEQIVDLQDLVSAHEAFLTSSLRAVAPLVRVDAHIVGRGGPGALTDRLAAAYTALVADECP